MSDHDSWTNRLPVWTDFKCDQHQALLWFMHHQRRYQLRELQQLPSWNLAKNIFLVDQEGVYATEHLSQDDRIHVWDSTVYNHPRFHSYLWWFDWCREIESHVDYTKHLTAWNKKTCDFLFEFLPGHLREHKLWVKDKIAQHVLKEKFLVGGNLRSKEHAAKVAITTQTSFPEGLVSGTDFDTGSLINYNQNQQANASCFLPYKIYNQTWYSVICESFPNKIFYTEKLAKPLIAQRLFVFFGARHTLKHLKSFGYRTFDTVIDESYDDVENDQQRWQMAWQQIECLAGQDPAAIYKQIQPIVAHNRELIMTQNWFHIMETQIQHIQN